MFACAAVAFTLSVSAVTAIPAQAADLEADARGVVALLQAPDDAALQAALTELSAEALALSKALRETGVSADLPCIFKGIGEDAAARAKALPSEPGLARRMALAEIDALMKDAILLAPQAGAEAEKAEAEKTGR